MTLSIMTIDITALNVLRFSIMGLTEQNNAQRNESLQNIMIGYTFFIVMLNVKMFDIRMDSIILN
jgi:hypothetical protein